MKSSQDIDSVWAGGAVPADNEFTCAGCTEFLSLALFCSCLRPGEQRFPTPAPTARTIVVAVNLLLTPQPAWGSG